MTVRPDGIDSIDGEVIDFRRPRRLTRQINPAIYAGYVKGFAPAAAAGTVI